MDIKFIDFDQAEDTITTMVIKHNDEIHDNHSWWNGVLSGYLEVCGLSWDVVDEIERLAGIK
jgi:hypothetical protein